MSALMSIAEHMIVERVIGNGSPVTGRLKVGLGLTALSGLLIAVGTGFLLFSAYLWMETNLPAQTAALYTGVLALGTAIVLSLIAYAVIIVRKRKAEKMKQELIETIHLAMEVADEELTKPVHDRPKTSILIASVAGYLIGERFI